jgi:hypothetical protein
LRSAGRRWGTLAAALTAVAALGVAGAAPGKGPGKGSPEAAVKSFYEAYLEIQPAGVPDEGGREKLHPLVSETLDKLLTDAAKAEADHAHRSQGEDPPLAEGDIFSSLFEGATSYQIISCAPEGPAARCTVALTGGGEDKDEVKWQDRIRLVAAKGGWVVDDIAYGGNWDFGPKGSLQAVLKAVIADSKQP